MKHNLRNVVAVAVLFSAASAFTVDRASGQVRPTIPCPIPMIINQTVSAGGSANAADFPTPTPPTVIEPNFNGTAINRWFRYTFMWKRLTDCCQYLPGSTLTVKFKALQAGPAGSATSANDEIHLFKGGSAVLGSAKQVYPGGGPVALGAPGQVTYNLTADMMTLTPTGDRLSFLVQDDSAVTEATLRLTACCVRADK
jgi:hypothetical protein